MNVEDFHDYRDFLKSRFQEKQSTSRIYSYQYFANKVGVTKSYLKMVIDKKRHVGLEKFFAIASFFSFSDFEKQFVIFQILKQTTEEKNAKIFFNSFLKTYPSRKPKSKISQSF